jgi:hypothetical protein
VRSAESKNAVIYEVREKMFPCWDLVVWKKIKDSFGLKVLNNTEFLKLILP